jgi:hypothetical protein
MTRAISPQCVGNQVPVQLDFLDLLGVNAEPSKSRALPSSYDRHISGGPNRDRRPAHAKIQLELFTLSNEDR